MYEYDYVKQQIVDSAVGFMTYEECFNSVLGIVFETLERALERMKKNGYTGSYICKKGSKIFTADVNTVVHLINTKAIDTVACIPEEYNYVVTDVSNTEDNTPYYLTENGDGSVVIMHAEDVPENTKKGDIITRTKLNTNKYGMVAGWDIFKKLDSVGQIVAEEASGVPMLTARCEISFKKQVCNIEEVMTNFVIQDILTVNNKKSVLLKLDNEFIYADMMFREFRTNWCKKTV